MPELNADRYDDLDQLFTKSAVPSPRADLNDRILAAARQQTPPKAANDRKPIIWSAMAGIAATLVAGVIFVTGQPDEADLWAAQADAAGFGDLYEWTYADGS